MMASLVIVMVIVPWLLRPERPRSEGSRPPAPPRRIRTERFMLRCWEAPDAPRLKAALDASLDHLHPWVPWARTEPYPLELVADRIEQRRAEFTAETGFDYGIFDPEGSELLGGAGLYPRVGPGALELGYWVRADRTGRGIATEAATELTRIAFETLGVGRVEMHIDPRNAPSLRIPKKLGYPLVGPLGAKDAEEEGVAHDTLVFALTREEYAATDPDRPHDRAGRGHDRS